MYEHSDHSTAGTAVSLVSAVAKELGQLPTMPIAQLRERYRTLFRDDPPSAFGPDLLRRSIAHRLQENAYGGLPREVKRQLNRLIKTMVNGGLGRIETPRRIKPGSELVRTWAGKAHRVIVLDAGYAYGGRTYSSLSEIATSITGTRWNGPRFFGLRSKATKPAASATSGTGKRVRHDGL